MPLGEPRNAAPNDEWGQAADVARPVEQQPAPRPCAFVGHLFHADLRYDDGVVVGQCAVCGERARIDHIPGGHLGLRAAALVEEMLEPDADVAELAGLLLDLGPQIDAELESLRSARALIATARLSFANRTLAAVR